MIVKYTKYANAKKLQVHRYSITIGFGQRQAGWRTERHHSTEPASDWLNISWGHPTTHKRHAFNIYLVFNERH